MPNLKRILLLFFVCMLWGSEWLLDGFLRGVPRLRLVALRCLVASVALAPWAVRALRQGQASAIGRNCLLGIGIIALPSALLAEASSISPGLAVLLFAASPLVAGLLDNQALDRQGGIPGAPYILGGLAGVAFLVRGSLSFSSTQGLSLLWVALAVLVSSFSIVKARVWLREGGLAAAVFMQMLSAAIFLGVYSLVREGTAPMEWTLPEANSVLLLGWFCSAIAYLLYYQLLRQYRASQITVVQWLVPAVLFAETTIRFRHIPAWDTTAGAALAMVCAFLHLRTAPEQPMDRDQDRGPLDPDAPLTLKITVPTRNPM